MLEELIGELIDAVKENTAVLISGGKGAAAAAPTAKPQTAAKKKAAKKGGTANPKVPTVAALKEMAKKIATAAVDPKACMEQIRALVIEVATNDQDDPSLSLDDFSDGGRILFREALDEFVYIDESSSSNDGMDI